MGRRGLARRWSPLGHQSRPKKLESQHPTGDDGGCNRESNQLASGVPGDRFLGRNIFGALDSFRCDLECPRESERHRKTQGQEEHDDADRPVRDVEKRKELGRDLDEQPGDNGIGNRNLVNVAALQLG